MPKQPNLPRVPLEAYKDIVRDLDVRRGLGAIGPMPDDPATLQLCLDALLRRLLRTDEKLAKRLRAELQHLANIEHSRLQREERKGFELERSLWILEHGKLSGLTHAPLILQQQRLRLNEFVAKQIYPTRLGERRQWLKTHQSVIVEILNLYTCLCRNHGLGMPSPYSIDELKKDSLDSCKTSSEFVLAVIACAHGTTPAQVANLVKPKKKNKS